MSAKYKVEAIPSKIIIKKGNIVFMGNSLNGIATVTESAKKYSNVFWYLEIFKAFTVLLPFVFTFSILFFRFSKNV